MLHQPLIVGALLLATFEAGGGANGLYLYSLANPARPALLSFEPVNTGLHTGTFGTVGGQRYIYASKNPNSPAVITYRVQPDSADKLVPTDATDFSPLLLEIRNAKPDLVISNLAGNQITNFLKQYSEFGLNFPVAGFGFDTALGIAIMSYDGRLFFGLLGDYDAMSDLDALAADLDSAIRELARSAGVKPKRKRVPVRT